jgi:hypothetical protein
MTAASTAKEAVQILVNQQRRLKKEIWFASLRLLLEPSFVSG